MLTWLLTTLFGVRPPAPPRHLTLCDLNDALDAFGPEAFTSRTAKARRPTVRPTPTRETAAPQPQPQPRLVLVPLRQRTA